MKCGLSVDSIMTPGYPALIVISVISVLVLEYKYSDTQLGFKCTAWGLQCEYFPSSVTKETSRRDLAELPQSTLLQGLRYTHKQLYMWHLHAKVV